MRIMFGLRVTVTMPVTVSVASVCGTEAVVLAFAKHLCARIDPPLCGCRAPPTGKLAGGVVAPELATATASTMTVDVPDMWKRYRYVVYNSLIYKDLLSLCSR